MKRLSCLRETEDMKKKVKFAPVAEQGRRIGLKIQRSLIIFVRVQVSPGAFSQCVGIWKTRLIQNQLLKIEACKFKSCHCDFYKFAHMAE